MASRSLLASQSMLRTRPSFTRTPSNSSTASNKSSSQRDSSEGARESHSSASVATEYFQPTGRASSSSTVSSTSTSATSSQQSHSPLSRSRPISIQLPPSHQRPRINTPDEPVTARGDLPGGYFPNHEPDLQPSYPSHPFQDGVVKGAQSSTNMSGNSSSAYSSTPTGPSVTSTSMESCAPTPDNFVMPMGKYHPANYKNKNPPPQPSPAASAHHARQPSDIKRKLQQYQRDMAQQAMMASRFARSGGTKPTSPRLLPLGSPGPVTPMELEESAGYLVAGGGGAHLTDSQSDMVGRMIRAEEERRRREGTSSPVAMAGGSHC